MIQMDLEYEKQQAEIVKSAPTQVEKFTVSFA
jgi:hypothetical protein